MRRLLSILLALLLLSLPSAAASHEDFDGDGVWNDDELAGNSDPVGPASRPETDDDGDGMTNRDEHTRLHANGVLDHAYLFADAGDYVVAHFGVPGASMSVTAPGGATMRVTYAPDLLACPACAAPAVAKVSFSGEALRARGAFDAERAVPADAFEVLCHGPLGDPARGGCLVGAGVDASWTLTPARNKQGLQAGMVVSIQGKKLVDVWWYDDFGASGDIENGGNGEWASGIGMPVRIWNWASQTQPRYEACSAAFAHWCRLDWYREESLLWWYVVVEA